MKHYLLQYNRRTGQLRHSEYEGDVGRREALRARLEAERGTKDADLEIVVISARSLDEVRRTHGRYFSSVTEQSKNPTQMTRARARSGVRMPRLSHVSIT